MTREFDDLIKGIDAHRIKTKKEAEENDLVIDFDEERDEVFILLWKRLYIFDHKGYEILDELWTKGILMLNKAGYLCVKDEWKDLVPIHNHLKRKEVEELAKKLNCETKDIHVHHKSITNPDNKCDNRLENLEVLHKDHHAQRLGYPTWEKYQEHLKHKNI